MGGKAMEPGQHGNGPQQGLKGSPGVTWTASCSAMGVGGASIQLQPAPPGVSDRVHEVLLLPNDWQRSVFKSEQWRVRNGIFLIWLLILGSLNEPWAGSIPVTGCD